MDLINIPFFCNEDYKIDKIYHNILLNQNTIILYFPIIIQNFSWLRSFDPTFKRSILITKNTDFDIKNDYMIENLSIFKINFNKDNKEFLLIYFYKILYHKIISLYIPNAWSFLHQNLRKKEKYIQYDLNNLANLRILDKTQIKINIVWTKISEILRDFKISSKNNNFTY